MARRRKNRHACPGQQLERRECLQIQTTGYRESGTRLIGAQGKFHCWPIESVNLIVIETAAGQRYLGREHHIALHGGRRRLEWGASKHSSSG